MTESYLNWEHYTKSLENCFERAFTDNFYTDVTLVSEDYQSFNAHRIILSTCSETFEQILKFSSNSHPLLFLNGFTGAILKDILQFIYKGQVNIPTEDLNIFVEKAKDLQLLQKPVQENQIKSNLEFDQESQKTLKESLRSNEDEAPFENDPKVFNDESEEELQDEDEIRKIIQQMEIVGQKSLESLQIDKNDDIELKKPLPKVDISFAPPVAVNQDIDVEALLSEVYHKDGFNHCPLPQCSYKAKRKELLRVHMSSTHDGPKYSCPYSSCSSRKYSSKGNLRSHMKNYHNCDECEEKFEENKDLKKHKNSVHPIRFLKNLRGLQQPIIIPNI